MSKLLEYVNEVPVLFLTQPLLDVLSDTILPTEGSGTASNVREASDNDFDFGPSLVPFLSGIRLCLGYLILQMSRKGMLPYGPAMVSAARDVDLFVTLNHLCCLSRLIGGRFDGSRPNIRVNKSCRSALNHLGY